MKGEKINISFTFILSIIVLSSFVSASYQGVVIGEGISGNFTFYNNNTYVTYVTGNASSFNQTYQNFAYNGTTAGQQYFLNLSGTNANQNLNIGNNNLTANWFLGRFNWVIATVSQGWLTFDGSTLTFNETRLNSTITQIAIPGNASWNETRANGLYAGIIWGYNQTYTGGTFNITYQNFAYNQTYVGGTYNVSYNNILNQSCPAGQVVNGTLINGTLQCTTVSASIPINGTRLTIANITNFDYNYNQSDGSYNATYAQWAYNQTVPANSYTDIASINLQANITGLNNSLNGSFIKRGGSNIQENTAFNNFNITNVQLIMLNGLNSIPQIYADNHADTGIAFPGPDIFSIITGGATRLIATATGFIGIGTTTPTRTLEVNGTLNVTQTHYANNVSLQNQASLIYNGTNVYTNFNGTCLNTYLQGIVRDSICP